MAADAARALDQASIGARALRAWWPAALVWRRAVPPGRLAARRRRGRLGLLGRRPAAVDTAAPRPPAPRPASSHGTGVDGAATSGGVRRGRRGPARPPTGVSSTTGRSPRPARPRPDRSRAPRPPRSAGCRLSTAASSAARSSPDWPRSRRPRLRRPRCGRARAPRSRGASAAGARLARRPALSASSRDWSLSLPRSRTRSRRCHRRRRCRTGRLPPRAAAAAALLSTGSVCTMHAAAVAVLARLGEDLEQALADPLAGHLDQAQRGDLGDLVLGAVAAQALEQPAQHEVAVALQHHVDEVDDDDAAEVAQPQLADDLLGRLEVVLGDGLLEVAALSR